MRGGSSIAIIGALSILALAGPTHAAPATICDRPLLADISKLQAAANAALEARQHKVANEKATQALRRFGSTYKAGWSGIDDTDLGDVEVQISERRQDFERAARLRLDMLEGRLGIYRSRTSCLK